MTATDLPPPLAEMVLLDRLLREFPTLTEEEARRESGFDADFPVYPGNPVRTPKTLSFSPIPSGPAGPAPPLVLPANSGESASSSSPHPGAF